MNILLEALSNVINEVKWIDTRYEYSNNNHWLTKKDWNQPYNQEPIKNTDSIKVFHGCKLETAVMACKMGISGKSWTPRTYSYEAGMNPVGLFVTVDFYQAKEFGYDNEAMCILEFTAHANDLTFPVWNDSDTFFGQGSNPMPFRNKEDRDAQAQRYERNASHSSHEYVTKSDSPALANSIFDKREHQALFIGDLDPNMIKRVWVNERDGKYVSTCKSYVPYKPKEFVKKFYSEDRVNKFSDHIRYSFDKCCKPTDDIHSVEDVAERIFNNECDGVWFKQKEHYNGDWDAYKQNEINQLVYYINEMLANKDYHTLKLYLYPKQLIQLLGKEEYERAFDRFGIGTKNIQ